MKNFKIHWLFKNLTSCNSLVDVLDTQSNKYILNHTSSTDFHFNFKGALPQIKYWIQKVECLYNPQYKLYFLLKHHTRNKQDLYRLIKDLEIKNHDTANFLDLTESECLIQQHVIAPKLLLQ